MLGLFATSFSSYPLTFTYVGQAEAPQGMADVLEAKGSPNLTMRLFVYRDTHLPVMLTWQGQAPGAGRGVGRDPPVRSPGRRLGLRLPLRLQARVDRRALRAPRPRTRRVRRAGRRPLPRTGSILPTIARSTA